MEPMKSFVFYLSFYEAMEDMTDEQELTLYRAISKYALFGEEPSLTGVVKLAFTLIKPQLEANRKKRIDGKKGGRPSKEKNDLCGFEPEKPVVLEYENHRLKNKKPNENVNANDNENENENNNENIDKNEDSLVQKDIPQSGPKYHPDWFERFWALYPRKQSKRDAINAWDKLKPSLELCKIMDTALREQITWEQWQNPKYIPLPGPWLRGERWNDQNLQQKDVKKNDGFDDFRNA